MNFKNDDYKPGDLVCILSRNSYNSEQKIHFYLIEEIKEDHFVDPLDFSYDNLEEFVLVRFTSNESKIAFDKQEKIGRLYLEDYYYIVNCSNDDFLDKIEKFNKYMKSKVIVLGQGKQKV